MRSLADEMFASLKKTQADQIQARISRTPPGQPFHVSASFSDESLRLMADALAPVVADYVANQIRVHERRAPHG